MKKVWSCSHGTAFVDKPYQERSDEKDWRLINMTEKKPKKKTHIVVSFA